MYARYGAVWWNNECVAELWDVGNTLLVLNGAMMQQ